MDSNQKQNKQYLFDNPKNVNRILYLLYACCTLLVVLDFVIHRHVYHSWENLPLFYPIYGFVGCVILVLIARWMRTFLMRPEDYYDNFYDDHHDSSVDHHCDNNSENILENAANEHTHKGASEQAKNNKIGDHNVDA
ncbi:hypothetical protein L2719_07625 [Shewanella schlegeliana]|uniref:Uncharacterized protein n=1 Tax=Shewanella schlegeliana TaxID=190308 RepID=A0ABS1T0R1_9GAMM|nr:hypothetical protein [Shewanella schlegeliana]MBL4914366.1 hypothetical protein [Shewanella schlegeliana]MCL1109411.1 hypothetical protein [Shewanella schlegeliana]GIU31973.1 hypothetical protein TUM4433_24350 [Shewanella schlegeliana]